MTKFETVCRSGKRICEILGQDPSKVKRIEIVYDPRELVHAVIHRFLSVDEAESLSKELEVNPPMIVEGKPCR